MERENVNARLETTTLASAAVGLTPQGVAEGHAQFEPQHRR